MSPGDVSTYNTYVLYLLAVVEVNVCVYLVSFLFENVLSLVASQFAI